MIIMKAPEGSTGTSISFEGETYELAGDGTVSVPDSAIPHLRSHGFTVHVTDPEAGGDLGDGGAALEAARAAEEATRAAEEAEFQKAERERLERGEDNGDNGDPAAKKSHHKKK